MLGGPPTRSGFPPPSGRVTPPRCGLVLLRRSQWLHVAVRDGDGVVIFESDAFDASGAIGGNDNDTAPASYEPHYDEITSSDLRACDGR